MKHPRYAWAKAKLRDLIELPHLFDQTLVIRNQFREALAKDETGFNCVLYIEDWHERLKG